jgi:protein-disulfide isomerase
MTKEVSKRQARREQIRRKEQRGKIIGISLMTLGAVVLAFLFIYPQFKPVGAIATPETLARPEVNFNSTGAPDAPIKIDEYSDFQCSHCRNFYQDIEAQIIDAYVKTGKVLFTYNSFGSLNKMSGRAAEAAYCGGDQGKFWEMHDIIMINQTGAPDQFTDQRLEYFAETLELDLDEFSSCFDKSKYADLVDQDYKDGSALNITGTPTFILSYEVNGETRTKSIEGAQPFEVFQQEIEAALAEMGE